MIVRITKKKLQQYVTENTTVPLVLTLFIGVDDEN